MTIRRVVAVECRHWRYSPDVSGPSSGRIAGAINGSRLASTDTAPRRAARPTLCRLVPAAFAGPVRAASVSVAQRSLGLARPSRPGTVGARRARAETVPHSRRRQAFLKADILTEDRLLQGTTARPWKLQTVTTPGSLGQSSTLRPGRRRRIRPACSPRSRTELTD